jgi:hypothetical protein
MFKRVIYILLGPTRFDIFSLSDPGKQGPGSPVCDTEYRNDKEAYLIEVIHELFKSLYIIWSRT